MKQNISEEQWNELNKKEMIEYITRCFAMHPIKIIGWKDKEGYIEADISKIEPLPNIGQMIEFLGDDRYIKSFLSDGVIWENCGLDIPKDYIGIPVDELCDSLWDAVKKKLKELIKKHGK